MPILDKLIPHTDSENLHVGEAYVIWTQAMARYDTLELAQRMISQIHDNDLKILVKTGITNIVEPQISKLENYAQKYNIPLPPRPPKSVNAQYATDATRDESVFKIIFDGSQSALLVHIKAINMTTNDTLRKLFKGFLIDDLDNYDSLVKFGKFKGWIKNPPIYGGSKN